MKKKEEEAEFEVVPKEDYVEDSDDDLTEEQRATALVIGQKMFNNPALKEDLIDSLYNRYAFNDGVLPKWFTDDEGTHNTPQAPITKSEIEAMKAKLKELNARPIKKVAEAKARKKMRLAKKLEGAKSAAEAIAKNEDLTPADRMKAMEKIYAKSKRGQKKKVVLVVNRKSGGQTAKGQNRTKGSRLKLVDSRMRKDMRNEKFRAKNKKKR
jgi:AdoMet-dependent rRNA methyltransferase SPB1